MAKYPRGRPAKGAARTPIGYEYLLNVKLDVDANAVAPLRLEAGCFVLICNLSGKQERMVYIPVAESTDGAAKVIYTSKDGRARL